MVNVSHRFSEISKHMAILTINDQSSLDDRIFDNYNITLAVLGTYVDADIIQGVGLWIWITYVADTIA